MAATDGLGCPDTSTSLVGSSGVPATLVAKDHQVQTVGLPVSCLHQCHDNGATFVETGHIAALAVGSPLFICVYQDLVSVCEL